MCQNAELNEKLGRINRFMQFNRYEDAAMMGENMLLAAHFPGLGACYVGRARLARVINSAGESVPR